MNICGQCGKLVTYVTRSNSGLWVHNETGRSISNVNGRHDANTNVTTPAVAPPIHEGWQSYRDSKQYRALAFGGA